MNKRQGLVCWGPHVHIENFWYSGAILAMSHLIFMFAFLHSSTAHSHFIDEGTGKKAGKNVKDPQLYSLSWHTALLSSFFAVMMKMGISTFILNMQLIIITAPVGREFMSATCPGHRELQDVVTELCPCAWGAGRRQLLGNPGGLLRCCPSQWGSRWCATEMFFVPVWRDGSHYPLWFFVPFRPQDAWGEGMFV